MGPPSYMWSIVDRNVVMRHIPVKGSAFCSQIVIRMIIEVVSDDFLNPLPPNDAYAAFRVLGWIPDRRRICFGQLWSLLYKKKLGLFLMLSLFFFVTVCMKKSNLLFNIPAFFRLHPECTSTSEGDQTALQNVPVLKIQFFFSISRNWNSEYYLD